MSHSRAATTSRTDQHVLIVESIQDFVQFIDKADQDEICVIKFHANFCKVCQRVNIKYKKLAADYYNSNNNSNQPQSSPNNNNDINNNNNTPKKKNIKFADVELTTNSKLCQILDIKKFPYVQIYRNGECVASFSTGPVHNFNKVVGDTLQLTLTRTNKEWDTFRNDFHKEIQSGVETLNELREIVIRNKRI